MIRQARSPTQHEYRRHRQSGIALITFTIGALAVLGMAGMALDLGMAYLTKTRLQNALDAAALDGAQTLNLTFSTTQASAVVLASFSANMGVAAAGLSPVVQFSPTLTPFVSGGPDPHFVRVSLTSLPVTVQLAKVVGITSLSVSGSAVAGAVPKGGTLCGALPVMLCADDLTDPDKNCFTDLKCFGLDGTGEKEIVMKQGDNNKPIGPGNYGLIVLRDASGPGGKREELALAGDGQQCFTVGEHKDTEPGVKTGPVDGLNTRFGIYQGDLKNTEDKFPPDVVTAPAPLDGPSLTFAQYDDRVSSGAFDKPNGVPQRRVVLIPIAACPENGRKNIEIVGEACFFLTRPAGGDKASIFGEMIHSCPAGGTQFVDPGGGGALGPFSVILYNDPLSPQT